MLIIDLDSRYERVNDAFCAIVGYSHEQLTGISFDDYLDAQKASVRNDTVVATLAREVVKVAAGVLGTFALIPGLPKLPFLLLAAGLAWLGHVATKAETRRAEVKEAAITAAEGGLHGSGALEHGSRRARSTIRVGQRVAAPAA